MSRSGSRAGRWLAAIAAGVLALVGTAPGAASGATRALDTGGMSIEATIPVGGDVESLVVDPALERLYLGLAGAADVVVVDTAAKTITAEITIDDHADRVDELILDPTRGRLFALARSTGTLASIDTKTSRIRSRLNVGAGAHQLLYDQLRGRLYDLDMHRNRVRTIDVLTMRTVRTRTAPLNALSMALDEKRGWLYFDGYTNRGGALTVIDARTWRQLGRIPGVDAGGGSMVVDPAGTRLYASVIDDEDPGTMAIIDTKARKVIADITVGMWPGRPVVDPTGQRVYLATSNEPELYAVDTATNQALAPIDTRGYPSRPILDAARHRLYVVSRTSSERALIMVDTSTGTVTGSLGLPIDSGGLVVDLLHDRAYTSDSQTGAVVVIALPG
jgi:DNA-binding beta-propeller fold protein YncE